MQHTRVAEVKPTCAERREKSIMSVLA